MVEPVPQVAVVTSGLLLRHITTPPPRRMDSLRAYRMSARKVFTVTDIVVVWTSRVNDGAASVVKIAIIASTTISSSRVKPWNALPGWVDD